MNENLNGNSKNPGNEENYLTTRVGRFSEIPAETVRYHCKPTYMGGEKQRKTPQDVRIKD
jgi:hypothetical protein